MIVLEVEIFEVDQRVKGLVFDVINLNFGCLKLVSKAFLTLLSSKCSSRRVVRSTKFFLVSRLISFSDKINVSNLGSQINFVPIVVIPISLACNAFSFISP